MTSHQTHYIGPLGRHPFVRISFAVPGSDRLRTCWAIKLGDGRYMRASVCGDVWVDPGSPSGTERSELIVGASVERPAGINLTLGELELM